MSRVEFSWVDSNRIAAKLDLLDCYMHVGFWPYCYWCDTMWCAMLWLVWCTITYVCAPSSGLIVTFDWSVQFANSFACPAHKSTDFPVPGYLTRPIREAEPESRGLGSRVFLFNFEFWIQKVVGGGGSTPEYESENELLLYKSYALHY